MCLNQIKQNIHIYEDQEQLMADIQLIWDNCRKFSKAKSFICQLAAKMEKFVSTQVNTFFDTVQKKVKLEEKKDEIKVKLDLVERERLFKTSKRMKSLNLEQIKHIIAILEELENHLLYKVLI